MLCIRAQELVVDDVKFRKKKKEEEEYVSKFNKEKTIEKMLKQQKRNTKVMKQLIIMKENK